MPWSISVCAKIPLTPQDKTASPNAPTPKAVEYEGPFGGDGSAGTLIREAQKAAVFFLADAQNNEAIRHKVGQR